MNFTSKQSLVTLPILYQAYGNINIINECKFSLLRLLDVYAQQEPPPVIIYTDDPQSFQVFEKSLNIVFRQIDAQQILQWKGDINFVHRVKIEVIKEALSEVQNGLVYCDTDTYCMHSLQPIFQSISPSTVFFHLKEGVIENDFKKWTRFFKLTRMHDVAALQTEMWNAGVIGLHKDHMPLLNDVLALTDEIYPKFSKHTVEQFSFCYTFQKHGIRIAAAEPVIFHYWDLKEFRLLLKDFFDKYKSSTVDELVSQSKKILPEFILPQKMKFKRSGFIKKVSMRLTSSAWKIKQHFI